MDSKDQVTNVTRSDGRLYLVLNLSFLQGYDMSGAKAADLILPKQDITLHYYEKIDSLCKPIYKFDITFFNYLKVYNNGTIADLNNDPTMTEYFYYRSNLYQQFSPVTNNVSFQQGFLLDSSFSEQDFFDIMRNSFDIDHVIFFIEKKQDATIFWQFGTRAGNHKIVNFYLNNLELLKKFILYFSDQNREMLELSDQNRYKVVFLDNKKYQAANQENVYPYKLEEIAATMSQLTHRNEYHLLTLREKECLKLCISGKTAKEIARDLNISNRTVEVHIKNAKRKMNCTRVSQLFSKVVPFSL